MGTVYRLEKTVFFPYPVDEVFAYHSNICKIVKLVPNYLKLKIIDAPELLELGDKIILGCCLYFFPFLWKAEIIEYEHNVSFIDISKHGPFSLWKHYHLFKESNNGTLMTDLVEYKLPFSVLGDTAHNLFVREELERIFDSRHRKALKYLAEGIQATC